MELKAEQDTWFIARSDDQQIIHYGKVPAGQTLVTGQIVLETFLTEEQWTVRKAELGVIEPQIDNIELE